MLHGRRRMDPRDGAKGHLGREPRHNKLDVTKPKLLAVIERVWLYLAGFLVLVYRGRWSVAVVSGYNVALMRFAERVSPTPIQMNDS